ncbi:LEC14B protein [Tanacetum coccineum]
MSPIVHIVNIESAISESVANVTVHGRNIVAASSDESIYVYDLAANKINVRILAHSADVNIVCFADEVGHILYSGSDDHLCMG